MIKRPTASSHAHSRTADDSARLPDDDFSKLRDAIGAGVEAMRDPAVEAQVETYFRKNPNFSRDAVHVAAVATRFQREGRAGCRIR